MPIAQGAMPQVAISSHLKMAEAAAVAILLLTDKPYTESLRTPPFHPSILPADPSICLASDGTDAFHSSMR